MYKLIGKYKAHIAKYTSTTLDLNGTYPKEVWIAAGFSERILEKVN